MRIAPVFKTPVVKKYILPGAALTGTAYAVTNTVEENPITVPAAVVGGLLLAPALKSGAKKYLLSKPEVIKYIRSLPQSSQYIPDANLLYLRKATMPYVAAGGALGYATGKLIEKKSSIEKEALLTQILTSPFGQKLVGSKIFPWIAKNFASKATVEGVQGANMLSGAFKNKVVNTIESALPKAQSQVIDNPTLANTLKSFQGNRIRDYVAKDGLGKGLWGYMKNEVIHGPGTGLKAVGANWKNEGYSLNAAGNVIRKSRAGTLASRGLGLGMDAYFAGDALFGKVEPGESRLGKVMGAGGFIYGARSARKGIAGMIRGLGLNFAGQKLGDTMAGASGGTFNPRGYNTTINTMLPKQDPIIN